MDGLTLLRRASEAGLAVTAEGDRLVIRGPKRAEPVARLLIEHKPSVLAALAPSMESRDAAWWRREFIVRTLDRLLGNRTRDEAVRLAWGELQCRWHKQHGERAPTGICGGSRKPIRAAEVVHLIDGTYF